MAWETFPCSYTFPQNLSWIFETLWVIIFWVRVTHKILNVNWEKIHSIILSLTCHGLKRKLSPTHIHPLKTIREFLKPYELLFSELESLIKSWMWIGKKFTQLFYLSLVMAWETFPCSYKFPQNLSWIFETLWVIIFWVRVTHKMLNVNWEKIHSIILSLTCHGFRTFPQLIHIPSYPFMNFWNPTSYYFLS